MSDLRKREEATRQDKRAYHRLKTGVSLRAKDEKLRFFTLTFRETDVPREIAKRKFARLLRWIRKYWKIEYFLVHTAEGQGNVLHLAFFGDYLPFDEVQEKWKHLTGAHRIELQEIFRITGAQDFFLEMTRQRLTLRYSYSRGWLWKGCCRDWKEITRKHTQISSGRFYFRKKSAVRRWQEKIKENRSSFRND